ncbi:hypothetical protein pb186bvf_018710 [Paramecium bursaria]
MGGVCGNENNDQSQMEQDWIGYLTNQCNLNRDQGWAEYILKSIELLKPSIDTLEDIIILEERILNQQKIMDPQRKSKLLSKMLKRSGIDEENLHSQISKKEMGNHSLVQQSTVSSIYSSMISNNNPSFLCQERAQYCPNEQEKQNLNQQLEFYASLSDTIKQHTLKPNEMGQLIQQFSSYLIEKYASNINQTDAPFQESLNFTNILCQTLIKYYNLAQRKSEQKQLYGLVNIDTLYNFTMGLIIQKPQIYEILFQIIKNQQQAQIEMTTDLLKVLQDKDCQFCGIVPQFQLQGVAKPYMKAIVQLRKIQNARTPAAKMRSIIECSKSIYKTIKNYHNKNVVLQADDLLPILTYIVIQAQIFDLEAHLHFTEQLCSEVMRNQTCGYYLKTLQVVLISLPCLLK